MRKASLLTVFAGLLYVAWVQDTTALFVPAAALCLTIFLTLINLAAAANTICPLCRCTPFLVKRFAVRNEAKKCLGSVTLPVASKVLTQGRFDCPYCEFDRSLFKDLAEEKIVPMVQPSLASQRHRTRRARSLPDRRNAS